MKVLIFTDMEGVCGLDSAEGYPRYESAREFLMRDMNAAVEGILRDGKHEIYVLDGHCCGNPPNFIEGKLHKKAVQIPFERFMEDAPKFDAGMCVGYHAMAGTQEIHRAATCRLLHWRTNRNTVRTTPHKYIVVFPIIHTS